MYNISKIQSQISANATGHFEVRKTSWIPSNRMYLIEDVDKNKYAKIWLGEPPYKMHHSESTHTTLTLNSIAHPQYIPRFEQQFDLMWNNCTSVVE